MDKLFLKTYFYVLLGLSIIFAIIFSIFDLNELYTGITYHAEVIPAVVVTGAFAVLCFLSLLIAAICVRRWGNTPIRFSWGNLIFFLLFSALCVFILWETPAEMTLIEYVKLCYSDVILLGASALISVTLISAISYVFRQTKNQIGEDVEASKNWYLVFILLTLLSALIYLIIGVLMFERGYNQFGTTFYLLFIAGTILVSTIVTASLSVSGSMLMEKNRPLAFLMVMLTAIAFLIPHAWCISNTIDSVTYLPVGKVKKKVSDDDAYSYSGSDNSEYSLIVRNHDVENNNDNAADSEEIVYDGDLSDVLASEEYNPLWYHVESPKDSIAAVIEGVRKNLYPTSLIYFFNFRHLNDQELDEWENYYYVGQQNDMVFLKACRYISQNRNEVQLGKLIKAYRPLIKAVITKDVFFGREYDSILKWLRCAYDDLSERGNGEKGVDSPKFKEIYDIMSEEELSGDSERYEKYYAKIAEAIDLAEDELTPRNKLFRYTSGNISKEELVWAYSFWGRRWAEGNIEKALDVISIIEEMYIDESEE